MMRKTIIPPDKKEELNEDDNGLVRYIEPRKMTLYQAYKRKIFCPDDDAENLRIYNKKRRGYEGYEKTVLVDIDS